MFFPSFSFSLVLSPSPLFDFMPLYPAVSLCSGLNFFANSCSFANSYLNGTLSRQQTNAYTCKYKDSSSLANTNTHTHNDFPCTHWTWARTHKLFPPTQTHLHDLSSHIYIHTLPETCSLFNTVWISLSSPADTPCSSTWSPHSSSSAWPSRCITSRPSFTSPPPMQTAIASTLMRSSTRRPSSPRNS